MKTNLTRAKLKILPLLAMLLFSTACGQMSIGIETATPAIDTPLPASPTAPLANTPTPEPEPTAQPSPYWNEIEDPYHSLRFAVPCFWVVNFPVQDSTGTGAFSYPVKNYQDDFALNYPRSAIPAEAGAIKIDMAFLSGADWGVAPGATQPDFLNTLYGGDSETRLVSVTRVQVNGQPASLVTTENIFGPGQFYLFTVTADLFLAFAPPPGFIDHPDVQGILNSIALTPEVAVLVPATKPGPPPLGLAAPCIPDYQQAVVPTLEIPPANTACGLSSFGSLEFLSGSVQQKLTERNYGSLHYDHFINDPFVIGYWGSEGVTLTPLETASQLSNNLLPVGTGELTFTTDRASFPPLAGMPPENMFGPSVKVTQVVYSQGWGPDGKGASLLYFVQDQCGGYFWHGLVYSQEHFDR